MRRMERRRSSTESCESLGSLADLSILSSRGWLRAMSYLVGRRYAAVSRWPWASWRAFANRGYVFAYQSVPMTIWDMTLAAAALYFACYLPFSLVFSTSRWGGEDVLHVGLDVLQLGDVVVKLRTGYRDRGYDVIDPDLVMHNVSCTVQAI